MKCGGMVLGEGLSALGGAWHAACFTCAKCSVALAGTGFCVKDGSPYCQACHQLMMAAAADGPPGAAASASTALPTCAACQQTIVGQFLRALDAAWHPNCFGNSLALSFSSSSSSSTYHF